MPLFIRCCGIVVVANIWRSVKIAAPTQGVPAKVSVEEHKEFLVKPGAGGNGSVSTDE